MKESHQQGKDERKIEEQVDTFFQYNPMSNPEYLKAYVQKNPNNKMAWYLLGKYYEQQHKPGKARYCFEQSGAIYEAFEAHEIGSVDMASAESDEAPFRETKHKDRRRIIAALILILAAGLLFPSSERFEQAIPLGGGQLEVADSPPNEEGSMKELPPMSPPRGMDTVIYIHDDMDSSELGDFLFKHTTGMNSEFGTAALIWSAWKPDAQGWIMGAGSPSPIVTVRKDWAAGSTTIQYHDAEQCYCIPSEAPSLTDVMNVWSTRLEQQLVVSSALYHYRRANGELPDRSDQLHGDYPNNWMPGLDDPMEHTFQRSLSAAKAEETSNPDSKHAETDFETRLEDRLAGLKPPQMIPTEALGESLVYDDFNEPLEIIVDKQNYRLALVSGNLILRNYPVGLGGERTPTGEFVITEKVKNPNGRSDGDFGSRGMTLSDTLYAIHGTNEPESIGLDQSLGCVRMEAADVEELFDMVTLGTKVTIRDSGLPEEIIRPEERFSLPAKAKETNNSKVYKWLT